MYQGPGSSFWPRLQSGRLYREEYAMLMVVISLAGFLGLLLASTMPYALLQAQGLNSIGVPGGTVQYTNALGFPSSQVPNGVNNGGGTPPVGFFGKRRRRRRRRRRDLNEEKINHKLSKQATQNHVHNLAIDSLTIKPVTDCFNQTLIKSLNQIKNADQERTKALQQVMNILHNAFVYYENSLLID